MDALLGSPGASRGPAPRFGERAESFARSWCWVWAPLPSPPPPLQTHPPTHAPTHMHAQVCTPARHAPALPRDASRGLASAFGALAPAWEGIPPPRRAVQRGGPGRGCGSMRAWECPGTPFRCFCRPLSVTRCAATPDGSGPPLQGPAPTPNPHATPHWLRSSKMCAPPSPLPVQDDALTFFGLASL